MPMSRARHATTGLFAALSLTLAWTLFAAGPPIGSAAAADATYTPSPELLAAAQKEGKVVLYTANFLTTEQTVTKRFSERFPGIQVEMVRAPTGQLVARINTEAAANKLIADVIDISDRPRARAMAALFADYAPPNAADYPELSLNGRSSTPRAAPHDSRPLAPAREDGPRLGRSPHEPRFAFSSGRLS